MCPYQMHRGADNLAVRDANVLSRIPDPRQAVATSTQPHEILRSTPIPSTGVQQSLDRSLQVREAEVQHVLQECHSCAVEDQLSRSPVLLPLRLHVKHLSGVLMYADPPQCLTYGFCLSSTRKVCSAGQTRGWFRGAAEPRRIAPRRLIITAGLGSRVHISALNDLWIYVDLSFTHFFEGTHKYISPSWETEYRLHTRYEK